MKALKYYFLFIVIVIFSMTMQAQDKKSLVAYDTVKIQKKIMVIIYNPVIESRGSKKLTEVYKWYDPCKLAEGYVRDIYESSFGMVKCKIVETVEVDQYPLHLGNFRYDDESYMKAWETRKFKDDTGGGNYKQIIEDFHLVEKVEKHEIDEVWLFGAPGFSWYESTMVGDGAYYCNSDPVPDVKCSRKFIIMGFNYERNVDCMLEDLGHRTESIIWHIFGKWEQDEKTAWNKFTLYDKVAPGKANVGNIHFAPNSQKDYEWGNKTFVDSYCDDWYTYPVLPGNKRSVNCLEWGNGDMRLHHIWWFKHLPRALGSSDGILNNWWKYVFNYDEYK